MRPLLNDGELVTGLRIRSMIPAEVRRRLVRKERIAIVTRPATSGLVIKRISGLVGDHRRWAARGSQGRVPERYVSISGAPDPRLPVQADGGSDFDLVPEESIVALAILRVWPPDRLGLLLPPFGPSPLWGCARSYPPGMNGRSDPHSEARRRR